MKWFYIIVVATRCVLRRRIIQSSSSLRSFVRSIVRSFESRRPAVTSSIAMRGVPRFHSTDDAIDDDVVVLAQSAKRRDERRDEASGETSP